MGLKIKSKLVLSLLVSSPKNVTVTAPSTQIVGQSLTLECSVATVRGITSRVDIMWKTGNLMLATMEVKNVSSNNSYVMYSSSYTIPQLSTTDDGRVYQCEVVINTSPPVMATGSVRLDVIVPTPTVSITPSGPIQGAMVGSPQDIQCTVSTVSGVELSSVLISWMGPGGNAITNDYRIFVTPPDITNNSYTSTLKFKYLMEEDKGIYVCYVMILETNASLSLELISTNGKLHHVCNAFTF